jgi:hypothetical protein
MGCGCKNNGNQTNPAPQQTQQQIQEANQQKSSEVKSAIKKTIEKYYNINKTSNTNGWVKE